MAIQNFKQLEVTRRQLVLFEQAVESVQAHMYEKVQELGPLVVQAQLQALISMRDELKSEIDLFVGFENLDQSKIRYLNGMY